MRIQAEFTDERVRRVERNLREPTLDRDIHLSAGESETVDLLITDRRKVCFISNGLTLDSESFTSAVVFKTATVATHTITLAPGEEQVLPLDAAVDEVTVTSNSSLAGSMRIVVL